MHTVVHPFLLLLACGLLIVIAAGASILTYVIVRANTRRRNIP